MTEDGKIPETQQELEKALGAEQKEIEIKLDTGEVFKGKSPDEVLEVLSKAKAEATKTIRDREAQVKERDGRIRDLEDKLVALSTPMGGKKEDESFQKETYYQLLAEDPLAAHNYALAATMGVAPHDVPTVLRWTRATTEEMAAHLANFQFRSQHPDAPEGGDFADVMYERMRKEDRDWNAKNLHVSYLELVDEGKVKPVAKKPAESTGPEPPPPDLGAPSVSTSGEPDYWGMSWDQLEKIARDKGMR